jgi:17beta-estradiol 17-dehydrogenase / very-long-chain 3-oxoacyl-CoA reductase
MVLVGTLGPIVATDGLFGEIVLLLGLIGVARFLYAVFQFVAHTIGMGSVQLPRGSWAVITGATDGIGAAFAEQCAKKGMNVMLISRTESKLKEKAKELEAANASIEVKFIAFDFSTRNSVTDYEDLGKQLKPLHDSKGIGLLVNNVGASYEYPNQLWAVDQQKLMDIVNINCSATVQMTRVVLPLMIEANRGAIINISSVAGEAPFGLLSVYSASKGFVDMFSSAVAEEIRKAGKKVVVQSSVPAYVVSKLSKIRKSSLTVATPAAYARAALAKVGCGDRVVPFLPHNVQSTILGALPTAVYRHIAYGMHAGIRKAALRKAARSQ